MIERKLSCWRGGDASDRNMRGSILLWLKDAFDLWNDQEFEELLERECPGSLSRKSDMEQAGFFGYGYNALTISEEMIKFSFLKRYLSSLVDNGLAGEEPSSLASRLNSLFQYENNSLSYLSMMKSLNLDKQLSIDDLFECSSFRCPDTVFIKRLGQGKGGTTYKAYSENLQQYRAVKILNRRRAGSEARLMARLSGKDLENVVQIYDAGNHLVTVGREKAYTILMEYVDGQTLEEILKEIKLTTHEVLDYSAQILNGIQSLRRWGITHRDLNPRNIKVNSSRKIKILDFGIATDEKSPNAKDNRRYGASEGNYADDIFSFGLLLYKMATGKHLVYTRTAEMGEETYAKNIVRLKSEFYSEDETIKREYREKITAVGEVPYKSLTGSESIVCITPEIRKILSSCFEKEEIDKIKNLYPEPFFFYLCSRDELIDILWNGGFSASLSTYVLRRQKVNTPPV